VGSGYLKIFINKEYVRFRYLGGKKNQILRTTGSEYFKNFKEPSGFMKEPTKTLQF
jgi:hypothetical protein